MISSPGALVGRLLGMTKGEGLRAQLLRGGMGSISVKLGQTILTFLVSVVLARMLGSEGFGVYSFVYALIMVMAMPAQFGLANLAMRETAKAQADGHWGLMHGLWRWVNTAASVLSFSLLIGAGILAWIFSGYFTLVQIATFAWGMALLPLVLFSNLRGGILRGLRHVVAGQIPEFVVRPGVLVVLVLSVGLLWPNTRFTAPMAMALHVLAGMAAFLVGVGFLWRLRPTSVRRAALSIYDTRAWIASAIPLAFVAGMQVVNRHTDIVMLGFITAAEDVGVYRVVAQGGILVTFGLQAVNMVVAPRFAQLRNTDDMIRLQRIVTMSARASFLIALPVVFCFVIWGSEILQVVFGPEFVRGHTPLVILAFGQLVNAGMGSVGFLLNMTGHERDTARGVAVAACCNIILNLILIPPFGMNGAALATALTLVIWNALLAYSARKRMGIVSGGFTRATYQANWSK